MSQKTLADLAAAFQRLNALSKEEREKLTAWEKADEIPNQNSKLVRRDFEGRIIRWDEYGKKSNCGWEIDHIWPLALSGYDEAVTSAPATGLVTVPPAESSAQPWRWLRQ